jgi:hypothetical protein
VAVAVLVASAVLAGLAAVEGGSFVAGAPSATAPPFPALGTALGVYDAAAGYDLWLFPNGDSWTYASGSWSNITATAGVPANMEENSWLVYDAHDGYALLFGGFLSTRSPPSSGSLANSWKLQDGRWTNITSVVIGAPPPGTLGTMAYDSEIGKVVLFGGTPSGQTGPTNSTWTYAAGVWSNASVPGPPPLYESDPAFFALVDDPADSYLLYYDSLGRCPGLCALVWTYAGGTWTNRTASMGPAPRLSLIDTFAYDSTVGKVVAFSGCTSTASYTCTAPDGTFEYSAGNWTALADAQTPGFRDYSSWVDDPSDGGLMLVGGCCWGDYSGLSLPWQDLWVFSHEDWKEAEPWGGGPPPIWAGDGTWTGVVLLGIPAVVVGRAVPLRRSPRP